ncbi:hypothetical protein MVEN_00672700 [Mycena venus]|uniref:Uncharacterized protein n=1 Tax=Mycena venus TaxID=2733690 RepID=A0A8H6YRG6_9AGAR|nr:hypothetical protein MVEN_00672700 [Mycena venus]
MLRFESIHAGAWHDHYPGDTRIVLDLTRFISFYDTALAPSLIAARHGIERWDHRAAQISKDDLAKVKARVGEVLVPRGLDADKTGSGSGVDWQTLYRVVLDRYADRLEMVEYLLNTTTSTTAHERARVIQRQLRLMLTPYILYSARSNPTPDAVVDDTWAFPIWRGCATKHTSHIHSSAALQSRLTPSERLLLRALDETNHEICRVVVRMWVGGVRAGLDALLPPADGDPITDAMEIVQGWRADAQTLMAWLDWGVWVKCRPACGVEEMCYLPTWPFFWDRINDPERKDERWKRPQPRCIRKFEPRDRIDLASTIICSQIIPSNSLSRGVENMKHLTARLLRDHE